MSSSDPDSPDDLQPESLNRRSIAGIVGFAGLGVVGLFVALPIFQALGLEFQPAFWLTLAVEFLAFVGVAVSVLTLYRERAPD